MPKGVASKPVARREAAPAAVGGACCTAPTQRGTGRMQRSIPAQPRPPPPQATPIFPRQTARQPPTQKNYLGPSFPLPSLCFPLPSAILRSLCGATSASGRPLVPPLRRCRRCPGGAGAVKAQKSPKTRSIHPLLSCLCVISVCYRATSARRRLARPPRRAAASPLRALQPRPCRGTRGLAENSAKHV